jgi:transcriptional regulator with XRE-family HTH domain
MRQPKYSEIIEFLDKKGMSQRRLAKSLSLSRQYLSQLFFGDREMSDETLQKINRQLASDFKHPKPIQPTSEILPHEQLALDRESLKEKPLFKDDLP